jgi:hypothetical protein
MRCFMTAGPDILHWSWSLLRYRAWLTQDSATGCPVPAVHVRFGFTSSHRHRANWVAQEGKRSEVYETGWAAVDLRAGSYVWPLAITAQAIRAILLARATATTLNGFFVSKPLRCTDRIMHALKAHKPPFRRCGRTSGVQAQACGSKPERRW